MTGCDELDEMIARDMQDPEFRFWWYVKAPEFWLRGKLAKLLFWLRDRAHAAALWALGTSIVPVEDES